MELRVCIIVLFLIMGGIILPVFVTLSINWRPRKTYLDDYFITPYELQVPFENICFTTSDGITIRGWWMQGRSNNIVIGCSGKDGTKDDLIGVGTAIWRAGHSVLLFDCRDRGESDSAPRTLGYSERLDVEAAVKYAEKRMPGARVGILGFSMGAALAIMAAAEDRNIRAVVADSPYSSLYELVRARLKSKHISAFTVMPLVNLWNRLIYRYSLHEVNPMDQVKKITPRPLMIIHGEMDSIVPVSSAKNIYKNAGEPKELWIVNGADHCGAYFADRKTYMDRVATFFTDNFQG